MRSLLILLACALLLYAAFPTRAYYWDGVLFALNIEDATRGQSSPLTLFHPNHLVYTPFGYLLYRCALACGFALRAITVLQLFNIVASVAATAVVYVLARRFTHSALFCATLFAFGATWWKFSTDANAYIVSVLLLLLAMWFATATRPRWWAAVACHVGAMLFHELAIFTYPAILAAMLLQRPRRIGLCMAYIAGTVASVAAAYGICYSIAADHSRHPTLIAWVTSFASDSGYTRSIGQIAGSLASYSKLFVGGRFTLIRECLSPLSIAAFAICIAALVAAFFEPLRARIQSRTALLWAWAVPYVIFLAAWDPGSPFHKLFVWPAIVLLIAAYVPPKFALTTAIAAWNFGAFIYPHAHASADPVLVLAQKIDRELPEDATIYYSAFSPDDWYLDYFAPGRKWTKLTALPEKGTVCLDTTALASNPGLHVNRTWELVNAQHNIRLACRIAPP